MEKKVKDAAILLIWLGWLVGYCGISTLRGYLILFTHTLNIYL